MPKIYSLSISNFKGIGEFEQIFGQNNFVCLIGRGDSGKTTILEAINLVLSSNWKVSFSDNDFHNQNIEEPIEITATLYDLPESILKESKFGLYLRGIDFSSNVINDEVRHNDIPSITIKLVVTKSLEPIWYVVNERTQSDIEIKSPDRSKFNTFLVSDYIDRHFSWSKGSPLYTLLKADDSAINATELILETIREAKNKIDSSVFPDLKVIIDKIETNAQKFGVELSEINTTVDFRDIIIKEGKINLHDENTPIRLKGKGSKRLLSIAIQLELFSLDNGGILLIDEIEQGLEPDRVQNLARILKNNNNQVFITTHSRDVIVELNAEDLYKLSKNSNKLYSFNSAEQGILRSNPEAFFAKKIVLCEGATEVGIVRGINDFNYKINDFRFSNNGVRYLDCGGDSKIQDCINLFINKEYDVLVFCDSDNDTNSKVKELKQFVIDESICSVQCESGKAIENQIFSDVDFETIKKIFDLELLEDKSSLIESIKSKYTGPSWDDDFLKKDSTETRNAIGIASNKNKWIKRIDKGASVGEICMNALDEFKDKHLYKMLTGINNWADK